MFIVIGKPELLVYDTFGGTFPKPHPKGSWA